MERQALKAALEWYVENGADEAIGDEPIDRFAAAKAQADKSVADIIRAENPAAETKSVAAPSTQNAPLGASDARAEAMKVVQAAQSLEELEAAIAAFEGIGLKKTASNMVFADGNPKASIMYIGDAPAADDDRAGKPFVGVDGRFLDVMFKAIDIARGAEEAEKSLYLTNILNWRPPGGRSPAPGEIEASLPFIERHIQFAAPKILVFGGAIAAKALLGRNEGLSKLRKRWHDYTPQCEELRDRAASIPAIVTFAPSYLLNTPAQKRGAWADLLMIKTRLNAI
jgi:DNA polymerase